MRVLIVGGGGREHALGWKIAQSPLLEKLFFAPGNPGTLGLGTNVELSGFDEIVAFADDQDISLVVVGPEAPLVEGLVDRLADAGILCFGPDAFAAQLEGSKAFAKEVMAACQIPTAGYADFTDLDEALAYVANHAHPLVVKADGLAAGKGVTICANLSESEAALRFTMADRKFGDAGAKVVIEEFLVGVEASYHLICDGLSYLPLIAAKDHKALYDKDEGPNTGGMGTFAPNPLVNADMAQLIGEQVCAPVLKYMAEKGHPFRGVLFIGLMLTEAGPKVLEFNTRFGDPETQVMMPMLDFDLLPVLAGAAAGSLPSGSYGFKAGSSVCVVLAAAGYPETVHKGDVIDGLGEVPHGVIFHAGTRAQDDVILTHGGRVLGLTAWGDTMESAQQRAYELVNRVHFEGRQFRNDIGVIYDRT